MYLSLSLCVYVYIYICIRICVCIYIYTYTYIHMYIQSERDELKWIVKGHAQLHRATEGRRGLQGFRFFLLDRDKSGQH